MRTSGRRCLMTDFVCFRDSSVPNFFVSYAPVTENPTDMLVQKSRTPLAENAHALSQHMLSPSVHRESNSRAPCPRRLCASLVASAATSSVYTPPNACTHTLGQSSNFVRTKCYGSTNKMAAEQWKNAKLYPKLCIPGASQAALMTWSPRTRVNSRPPICALHCVSTMDFVNSRDSTLKPAALCVASRVTVKSTDACSSIQVSCTRVVRRLGSAWQTVDVAGIILLAICKARCERQ